MTAGQYVLLERPTYYSLNLNDGNDGAAVVYPNLQTRST